MRQRLLFSSPSTFTPGKFFKTRQFQFGLHISRLRLVSGVFKRTELQACNFLLCFYLPSQLTTMLKPTALFLAYAGISLAGDLKTDENNNQHQKFKSLYRSSLFAHRSVVFSILGNNLNPNTALQWSTKQDSLVLQICMHYATSQKDMRFKYCCNFFFYSKLKM